MNGFFIVGFVAIALLVLSLVLDDVVDGLAELGPDWLSLPVLAALLAGFGFVAGFVDESTDEQAVALGAGVGLVRRRRRS